MVDAEASKVSGGHLRGGSSPPSGRIVEEIYYAAIKAVEPYNAVLSQKEKIRKVYEEGNFNKLFVVGFGKASPSMAMAIEDNFSEVITEGVIVTKYGHTKRNLKSVIKVYEAGHPLPDENGLKATEKIKNLLSAADEKTMVLCLISGGGSSLLVAPVDGIDLASKREINSLLLNSGAEIEEINTVRKHLSKVKGGRLAELAYPAKVLSLIISDVIGDKIDVIASGPTAPDPSTYEDAIEVLKKYNLWKKIPQNIKEVLEKGRKGLVHETPKRDSKIFEKVENIIVGSNKIALRSAKKKAEEMGFETEILTFELKGEAREAGRWLAEKAVRFLNSKGRNRKICLLSGGETTVSVKGNGTGGRNMEFALSFAMEIEGKNGITLLSAGTDGTDGPTDAAGAIVDGETIKKAKRMGINPGAYLKKNDSYNFFKKVGGLFITGPTGTNVMDIQVVILE